MIFAREKRSIGRLFLLSGRRVTPAASNAGSGGLDRPPLARTSEIIVRTTRTRTFGAISTSISAWSSDRLHDPPDEAAIGDDRVVPAHGLDQRLVILDPLLLRPQDQEVHDHEDQDERDHLKGDLRSASGRTGPLREGGGDQRASPANGTQICHRFSASADLSKSARTIARGFPKATPSALLRGGVRAGREPPPQRPQVPPAGSCGPTPATISRRYGPPKCRASVSVAGGGVTPSSAPEQHDRRHGDHRLRRQAGFDVGQRRIARHEREAMAIGVDHHVDEIRVSSKDRAVCANVAAQKPQLGDHSRHSNAQNCVPVGSPRPARPRSLWR